MPFEEFNGYIVDRHGKKPNVRQWKRKNLAFNEAAVRICVGDALFCRPYYNPETNQLGFKFLKQSDDSFSHTISRGHGRMVTICPRKFMEHYDIHLAAPMELTWNGELWVTEPVGKRTYVCQVCEGQESITCLNCKGTGRIERSFPDTDEDMYEGS